MPTGFLDDPATVYPVTIDPSTTWAKSAWAFVDAAAPTTVYYNTTSVGRVGPWDAAGTHKSRSYYTFATTGLAGKHILSASFTINEEFAEDCTARPFEVWSTTALSSTTTWNNQPSWGTKYATITSNAGGGSACPAGNVSGDVTLWAQNVLAGGYTNATLGIKVADAYEATQAYHKQFGVVSVSVTYNSPPSAVSQLSIAPCAAGCPSTGTDYVNSARPTFASYATDSDSSQIAHYFSVRSAANPSVDLMIGHSTGVGSGSISWQVPATNALTDGDYLYYAWAYDGIDSGPTAGPFPFTIDATAPTAPTVSSTQPSGQLLTSSTVSFTFTGTTSDTVKYAYKLETGSYSGWISSGAATIYNVTQDAVHTLSVIAQDHAGNVSPAATYTFGGGLTSPADQDTTQQSVTLSAAGPSGYADVAYQWRRGSTGTWANIPSGDVGSPASWPVGPIGSTYTWNVASTAGAVDGLIQVRACLYQSLTDPAPVCPTDPTEITLAIETFSAARATTAVGPGTLAPLTGDYQVSATDVNMPSFNGSLSIGRTLTTLPTPAEGSGPTAVFGPGWSASLPGTDAGAGSASLDDETADGYVDLIDSDGSVSTYEATGSISSYPIAYAGVGDTAADGSVLSKVNASTFTLTDTDGTVTTWTSSSNGWLASSVQEAGSQSATSYTRDSAGRVTRILAPVPTGVSCANPDTTPGCRSLKLTYTTVTVGGTALTRLQKATFVAWDPQAGAMASVDVASYDYDANGRLAHAWDPRITPNLKTGYSYDSSGRLSTITPPGLAAWTLHYDTGHRLASVTRPDPSGATATTTVAYNVAVSGTGAPVDLSPTAAASWGQTSDTALTATAVFGPDDVPAAAPTSSDWPYASISYLDVNGREVNTANYGAGQWLIDTTRYDNQGNTVWSLTAGNRAQALAPTADTDPAAAAAGSTAGTANLLASTNVYSSDGSELIDSFGPMHPVRLANGTTIDARSHTHTVYDEGVPGTGGPYELPTTETSTVQGVDGTDYDPRVTHTGYDVINSSDPNEKSGWELRQATKTTTQLGSSANPSVDLVRITRYNTYGQVIETRLPAAAAGGIPGDTVTSYYTAGTSGTCVSTALAGLACSSGPAAQPSTGNPLPVTTTTYNLYDEPVTVTETAGSTVRSTTTSYDAAGRSTGSSIAVTPAAAGGTALPAVSTGYDSGTGLPTTVSAGGQTLTTGYDSLGRVTSYTDAGGNISTATYDVSGRVLTANDGKGTTSYTYDSATEHRGLITSEDLGLGTAPGVVSATYDPTGNASSVTYPNGLVATTTYDNTGSDTSLSYAMAATTWLAFTQTPGSDGNTAAQSSPASSQVFGYDGAGRLTQTQDTVPDPVTDTVSCTTRAYQLGSNSNRLSLSSYPDAGTDPGTGACSTATTPVTWSGSYDQADRITNTGYTYDTLGRTSTVPAADAAGIGSHASVTGDLSLGYYANDFAASQAQGGRTVGFTLDPMQNRVVDTTDSAAATVTNHYADAGDSPAWTSTGTSWTRNLIGLSGLTGTVDQTGTVTLDLADMNGDIVATSTDDPAPTGTTSYSESTEFGAPRVASSAPDSYGWLGTKRRSTNDLGGLTLMGIRLYNPTTGRFLSTDPVPGGNDNPYLYVTNPDDSLDIAGRHGWNWRHVWRSSTQQFRNIINEPASSVAMGWAALHGAHCSRNSLRGIEVCSGMHGGYGRAGTTVGSVYMTGRNTDYRRLRHEAKHANQWAWFGGGPIFPLVYFVDEGITGGHAHNSFERQAGLHDGCYSKRTANGCSG